jgi:hypothetical protein
LRLGFAIDNFEQTLNLLTNHDVIYSEPTEMEFGFSSVILDLDGRKIELYKR